MKVFGFSSSKNNPYLNPGDSRLFAFPEESNVMSNQPYWEATFGIHNIFKFFGVEYVRRLTYRDMPNADHWGLRFSFMMSF